MESQPEQNQNNSDSSPLNGQNGVNLLDDDNDDIFVSTYEV